LKARPSLLRYREIAEVAGIDERDVLYISPSNEALAHLPYMIALDKWALPTN
jgi:hypothetical protein